MSLPERLERVAGSTSGRPLLLDTQYRMHPQLAAFPSTAFYGGRLLSVRHYQSPAAVRASGLKRPPCARAAQAPKPAERLPPDAAGVPWPSPGLGLMFVNVPGPGETRSGSGDGTSVTNAAEAAAAVWLASRLAEALPGGAAAVGIVTPYAAQARLIEDLVRARHGRDGAAAFSGSRSRSARKAADTEVVELDEGEEQPQLEARALTLATARARSVYRFLRRRVRRRCAPWTGFRAVRRSASCSPPCAPTTAARRARAAHVRRERLRPRRAAWRAARRWASCATCAG